MHIDRGAQLCVTSVVAGVVEWFEELLRRTMIVCPKEDVMRRTRQDHAPRLCAVRDEDDALHLYLQLQICLA